jgi:purine-binding chemotaxis protein CheW
MKLPDKQFLTFTLHNQTYAIDLDSLIQVVNSQTVTPTSTVSGLIFGTMISQDLIVPVIDLRQYLGLPEMGMDSHRQVLVTKHGAYTVGWIVDRVLGIFSTSETRAPCKDQIRPGTVLTTLLGNALLLDLEHMITGEQQEIIDEFERRRS